MASKSSNLCVLVTEAEKQIVSLKLPAITIGWLETLIPGHVLRKIEENEIDLKAIKKKAQDSELAAQDLFELQSGARTYRVWLE